MAKLLKKRKYCRHKYKVTEKVAINIYASDPIIYEIKECKCGKIEKRIEQLQKIKEDKTK